MVAPAGLSARTPGCFDDRLKIGIAGLEPDEAAGQRWIGQEGRGSPLPPVDPFHGNADAAAHGGATYSGVGVRKPPTRKPRTAPRSATGGQRREKIDALVGPWPRYEELMSGRFWHVVALDHPIGGPSPS
jgi:hypothetical protein